MTQLDYNFHLTLKREDQSYSTAIESVDLAYVLKFADLQLAIGVMSYENLIGGG